MGPLTPIIGLRLLALAAGLRNNAEIVGGRPAGATVARPRCRPIGRALSLRPDPRLRLRIPRFTRVLAVSPNGVITAPLLRPVSVPGGEPGSLVGIFVP